MIKINGNIIYLERIEMKLNKTVDLIYCIINDYRAENYNFAIEEYEEWVFSIEVEEHNFKIEFNFDPDREMFNIIGNLHGFKKIYEYQTEEKAADKIFKLLENITYLERHVEYVIKEDIKKLKNESNNYYIESRNKSSKTLIEKGSTLEYISGSLGFDLSQYSELHDSEIFKLIRDIDFEIKYLFENKKNKYDLPYIKITDLPKDLRLSGFSGIRLGIFSQENAGPHCYSEEFTLETNARYDIDLISFVSNDKSLLDYITDEQLKNGYITTEEIKSLFDGKFIEYIMNNDIKIKWLIDPGKSHYKLVDFNDDQQFPIGEDYSS